MTKNTILDQMGVQQWRLRDNATMAAAHDLPVVNSVDQQDEPTLLDDTKVEKPVVATQEVDWSGLVAMLDDSQFCPSCAKVTPILGEGDLSADWMFVFDSPSLRDIEHQRLLTGRVGQLFDAILLALGLSRDSIYLSTVFKCPPVADIGADTACCDRLLQHQIKLVQPKVVIAFGEFVAQALIKANESLDQLRAQPCQCFNLPISVIPSDSLMQMLDSPTIKAGVWRDLKSARQIVEA